MGEPTLIQIHCVDCGFSGEKEETIKEATMKWNVECTSRRYKP